LEIEDFKIPDIGAAIALCKSHFIVNCEVVWAGSWSLGAGN